MLLLSALLLGAVHGCRCFPPNFQRDFYKEADRGTPLTRALVLSILEPADRNGKRKFTLLVTQTYTGCPVTKWKVVKATSFASGATCGVFLQKFVSYILPLKSDGSPSFLNSCRVNKKVSALTADENEFLRTRTLECNGRTTCVGGQRPFFCRRVCGPLPTGCTNAICRLNFCAGCTPEFFTADGLPACSS